MCNSGQFCFWDRIFIWWRSWQHLTHSVSVCVSCVTSHQAGLVRCDIEFGWWLIHSTRFSQNNFLCTFSDVATDARGLLYLLHELTRTVLVAAAPPHSTGWHVGTLTWQVRTCVCARPTAAARSKTRDASWLETIASRRHHPHLRPRLSYEDRLCPLIPRLTSVSWIKGIVDWFVEQSESSTGLLTVASPVFWREVGGCWKKKKRAGCASQSIKNCQGLAGSGSKTKLEVLHKSIPALCIPHISFVPLKKMTDRCMSVLSPLSLFFLTSGVNILQVDFKEIYW